MPLVKRILTYSSCLNYLPALRMGIKACEEKRMLVLAEDERVGTAKRGWTMGR